jgi:hypothetical protein
MATVTDQDATGIQNAKTMSDGWMLDVYKADLANYDQQAATYLQRAQEAFDKGSPIPAPPVPPQRQRMEWDSVGHKYSLVIDPAERALLRFVPHAVNQSGAIAAGNPTATGVQQNRIEGKLDAIMTFFRIEAPK